MTILEWIRRWRARSGARTVEAEGAGEHGAREDETSVDPFNPFPEPVRIEITDIIDLHTIPPREVRKVVEEYLVEARREGFRSVRIIHGKGKGLQRDLVRKILDRTPFVEDWMDAPPEAGGWGATIAHLSPE
jgi:dsDNA-specific endonuclease/ATPase MutS2